MIRNGAATAGLESHAVANNLHVVKLDSKAVAVPCHESVETVDSICRKRVVCDGVAIRFAVCFNQIDSHGVRNIDFVVHPRFFIIVYMPNEHSFIRQASVKAVF